MLLIPEKCNRHAIIANGKQVHKLTRLKFSLNRCKCGCGKEFMFQARDASSPHFINMAHKKRVKIETQCGWCGAFFNPPQNKETQKYCCERHAQLFNRYQSQKNREKMALRARMAITQDGMSLKAMCNIFGGSNACGSGRYLIEYSYGPYAWEYFKEIRSRYSAAGFKGKRTKPLPLKDQMTIKNSNKRKQVAKALSVWRKTGSTQRAGESVGVTPNSGSYILLLSNRYKAMSEKRITQSLWRRQEIRNGYITADATKESHISDNIAHDLCIAGFNVVREYQMGDWSRVDVYATHGVWRFAIEVKSSSRKARVAGCIGQALIAKLMTGAIPVVCIPSCFTHHKVIDKAVQSIGGILCTEVDITEKLKVAVGLCA